jgi:predicted DNA-binding transcriptional regulator AlpA
MCARYRLVEHHRRASPSPVKLGRESGYDRAELLEIIQQVP